MPGLIAFVLMLLALKYLTLRLVLQIYTRRHLCLELNGFDLLALLTGQAVVLVEKSRIASRPGAQTLKLMLSHSTLSK